MGKKVVYAVLVLSLIIFVSVLIVNSAFMKDLKRNADMPTDSQVVGTVLRDNERFVGEMSSMGENYDAVNNPTPNSMLAFSRDSKFFDLCKCGSLNEINDAILQGANVNARSEEQDDTPLIMAAGSNTNPQVITALINAGADIARKNSKEETPLMYAARNKLDKKVLEAMIKTLLEAGDDINAENKFGETALLFAAKYSNVHAVLVLLDSGANAKIRSKFGIRPLDLAEIDKAFAGTDALKKLKAASKI
jgi:ankyrin repeat protein